MTILVTGGTGKTGRRIVDRLGALSVRVGSRTGDPPFDWADRGTWDAALDGARAAYISYYPDLAFPGALEDVRAFTERAMAAELSKATGRQVAYVPVTAEEYAAGAAAHGVPQDEIALLTKLFTEVLDGRNAHVADGVRAALGRPARDFADFARDNAGTWMNGG